jgi:hypothetical protein
LLLLRTVRQTNHRALYLLLLAACHRPPVLHLSISSAAQESCFIRFLMNGRSALVAGGRAQAGRRARGGERRQSVSSAVYPLVERAPLTHRGRDRLPESSALVAGGRRRPVGARAVSAAGPLFNLSPVLVIRRLSGESCAERERKEKRGRLGSGWPGSALSLAGGRRPVGARVGAPPRALRSTGGGLAPRRRCFRPAVALGGGREGGR